MVVALKSHWFEGATVFIYLYIYRNFSLNPTRNSFKVSVLSNALCVMPLLMKKILMTTTKETTFALLSFPCGRFHVLFLGWSKRLLTCWLTKLNPHTHTRQMIFSGKMIVNKIFIKKHERASIWTGGLLDVQNPPLCIKSTSYGFL